MAITLFIRPGIYHQMPTCWFIRLGHNEWESGRGEPPKKYQVIGKAVLLLPSTLVSCVKVKVRSMDRKSLLCRFQAEIGDFESRYHVHEVMKVDGMSVIAAVREEVLDTGMFELKTLGLECQAIIPDMLLANPGKSVVCGNGRIVRETKYSGVFNPLPLEGDDRAEEELHFFRDRYSTNDYARISALDIWQWDFRRHYGDENRYSVLRSKLSMGVTYATMFALVCGIIMSATLIMN